MRNILVDHARANRTKKRGAGAVRAELTELSAMVDHRTEEILAVSEALDRLRQLSPRQLKVVELRFFCGYTEEEIAAMFGVSPKTIKRDWTAAKAWLAGELGSNPPIPRAAGAVYCRLHGPAIGRALVLERFSPI